MNAPAVRAAEPTVRGTDRRRLGPGARATRQALLDAVDVLLLSTPWSRVRVAEVAELVGVGTSSFYQYFSDLEDAVRQLVSDRRTRRRRISKHLRLLAALLEYEATGMGAPR